MPAGQGVGAIDALIPAGDLVRRMVAEAEATIDRVAAARMSIAEPVDREWDESILPTLHDYIRIPNVSPAFDPSGPSTATWTAPSSWSAPGARADRSPG